MAQVNYNEGVPDVTPREQAPEDYQREQANPEEFGGLIAQGAEKAGQGFLGAAKFFGQVAADNASNEFQDRVTKLLHGDPSKTVIGPDGQPQQDLGYLGTKGRAALDARPAVESQMDDLTREIRQGLQTPEQNLQFDDFTRRYRTYISGDIGNHADQEATKWYGQVNSASANLAMTHIAQNPNDMNQVNAGIADLIHARVKAAQLSGADPTLIEETTNEARAEGIAAWTRSVAVKDPSAAMKVLDNHKADVSVVDKNTGVSFYDTLANEFRSRADLQDGITLQRNSVATTYGTAPPAAPASVTLPQVKDAIFGQESGQGANTATSVTGAVGYGQIEPATFKQYARPGENINVTADNKAVGERIMADYYQKYNGDPYRVAVAYFSGPGNVAPPGSPTPWLQNKADPTGKSVASYVSDVASRLGIAPGSPYAAEAAAERQIMMSDASDPVKQHALMENQRFFREAQIATEADAKGKKDASDNAMGGYVSSIMTNGIATPDLMAKVAADPSLTAEAKENLQRFASEDFGYENNMQFGSAYPELYRRILLPPGDEQRISDPNELLTASSPGGGLTPRGADRLLKVYAASRKDPDQTAVNTVKSSLLQYAKSKLSFDQEMLFPGVKPLADPKGAQIYNAQFVPKFEAWYDSQIKTGKEPFEFLTQENVDKLMTGMRPKAQMQMDKVSAQGEVTGETQPQQPVPQAPQGVDDKTWQDVMATRPTLADQQIMPPGNWAAAIGLLQQDPSDKNVDYFNKAFPGFDGAAIVQKLGRAAPTEDEAAGYGPAKEPPPKTFLQRLPQTMLPPEMRTP